MRKAVHPVVVRGAGDLASGVILRLMRAHVPVVALETALPLSVRRTVSFSEAVYEGSMKVEDTEALLASSPAGALDIAASGRVAVLVDPDALSLPLLEPRALVDAIMAKKNCGTLPSMAPHVVAIGPGFAAGTDADAVVETQRGHDLGRVIWKGSAAPNSGIPGIVLGHGSDRVFRAHRAGKLIVVKGIGCAAGKGDLVACIEDNGTPGEELRAPFDGMVRGMLRGGFSVWPGLKLGDLDPRCEQRFCTSVSDKALAVAGGVMEALLCLLGKDLIE